MNNFKYTAVNKKGEISSGVMESKSQDEVANVLIESGLTPVKISEKFDVNNIFQTSIARQRIPQKEKVIFLREFSTMISAGLALDDALDVSVAQAANKTLKAVLQDITKDIRTGASLSSAFEKFPRVFGPIEISLIKAGEVSGKMDAILNRLADDVEKSSILRGKVRGALTYPA